MLLSLPPPGARSVSPDGASSFSATGTATSANGATSDEDVELITEYSWRNFFSTVNFVHILQKLTKRKTHRVLLMVQYKSSVEWPPAPARFRSTKLNLCIAQAILKRILKVSHPTLQLYVLKVIKSQVPYCGRKWRQCKSASLPSSYPLPWLKLCSSPTANMKVITAIYLHVRPDLRDEWLAGVDVDADVEESLVSKRYSVFEFRRRLTPSTPSSLMSKPYELLSNSSTRNITANTRLISTAAPRLDKIRQNFIRNPPDRPRCPLHLSLLRMQTRAGSLRCRLSTIPMCSLRVARSARST